MSDDSIKAPDRIWLQVRNDDGEDLLAENNERTWCEDRIYDTDVEYIRFAAIQAQQAELRQQRDRLLARLSPSVEYVEGMAVGPGEDEIDRQALEIDELQQRVAELEAVLRRIASSEFDSVPDNARALRKAGQQLTKEAKSALGEGE